MHTNKTKSRWFGLESTNKSNFFQLCGDYDYDFVLFNFLLLYHVKNFFFFRVGHGHCRLGFMTYYTKVKSLPCQLKIPNLFHLENKQLAIWKSLLCVSAFFFLVVVNKNWTMLRHNQWTWLMLCLSLSLSLFLTFSNWLISAM